MKTQIIVLILLVSGFAMQAQTPLSLSNAITIALENKTKGEV